MRMIFDNEIETKCINKYAVNRRQLCIDILKKQKVSVSEGTWNKEVNHASAVDIQTNQA